jgi:hypothetical protein
MGSLAPAPQKLPARVQLPSGQRVAIRVKLPAAPLARKAGAPLFSEVLAAETEGLLEVSVGAKKVPLESLGLSDFHAVRALALAAGVLHERSLEIPCKNCDAALVVWPCRSLPLGPFRDFELSDEELDATLPFGEAHEIEEVSLGDLGPALTVTFAPRTAKEAQPLFRALARDELRVDEAFVSALGIVKLGAETRQDAIAQALSECDDDAFSSVTDVFLASHYPLRLGAPVTCATCGARNDVDAPYEREIEPGGARKPPRDRAALDGAPSAFSSFDELARMARRAFDEHVSRFPADTVDLVVTNEVPACDDGGEPLLGSYVPGSAMDDHGVGERPTVTLYVRTFRAMWDQDGPYDVQAEVWETVEHELLHHEHHLTGEDPMDEEERAEIVREAQRVIGKKQVARDAARGLGADVGEFARRTWLIWLLLLGAGAAAFWAEGR